MASRLMLLGQVVSREVLKPKVVNVRVVEQVFDKHINMFFAEPTDFKAAEGDVKVTLGDLVRIDKLPEKLTVEVEYKVADVVFPIGRVVDPITGRKCRGTRFIDDKAREEEAKRVARTEAWKNYPL
ncbi:28S ribosomal protein S17, mitochondrial [Aplysia californica]|uniref:28S ribosomal protein S17, mitochondrial n=1 Tax=Aplysia californica TaxID=6500 RepID=A0ABM0JR59_APLCA|nr:28S ribosomal protein S17, mitochondrial [Aplysia californica]XP_005099606.1 28S ribosomal protein S17, mitochondrial [Aplysia californica]XP_035825977.1 28S ribosomal protein S17, mitochondrial [Aplysia californica]XP_035825978.1 28S ribosomal protein S17, mitochondrial [Aplysia californica]